MNKTSAGLRVLLALSMLCAVPTVAQMPPASGSEAKTKLETFQAQKGAVLVKGFSRIGKISALGTVEVTAMELTDAATGKKQTGVAIEVQSGRMENSSFIDYDEIPSLLEGLDYIAKATANVTKLKDFEARFNTRGNFGAGTYSGSKNGKVEATVTSGRISAFLSLQQLGEFRTLVSQAKQKLDSIK